MIENSLNIESLIVNVANKHVTSSRRHRFRHFHSVNSERGGDVFSSHLHLTLRQSDCYHSDRGIDDVDSGHYTEKWRIVVSHVMWRLRTNF